jgi:cytochrome c-type biogenesis protein CcmH
MRLFPGGLSDYTEGKAQHGGGYRVNGWVFWAAALGLSLIVVATLWMAARRARADTRSGADYDLSVYRDQLAEVERDIARGVLPPAEGARLRTEVARRVLDADRAAQGQTLPQSLRAGWGIVVVLGLTVVGVLLLYDRLGAPGYPDLPLKDRFAMSEELRQTRPSQAEAEAGVQETPRTDMAPDFADLMNKLRAAVIARPDDVQGLTLLARNEAALGNIRAAIVAQGSLITVKGAGVVAEDHAALAELLIVATGGYVSPTAEEQLVRALALDPANQTARYYSGVMFGQVGRFDRTFALWRALLEEGPADAPWIAPIRDQMPDVAARAGANYTLPAAPRGPSAGDIEAAGQMAPEDRQAMIAGMVDQLGARLAADGGPAEDWAQLINALAVLGRLEEAGTIYAEAQTRFAGRTVELSALREVAVKAGIATGGVAE